ncbi:MAG: hypothetical protein LBP68_08490 [Acidobacteriota bacterium]|nr:hypothetical protein [Acidobacteriota bacterium]
MKKISASILLVLLSVVFVGCSSTPEGTVAIKDLAQNIEQKIGQKVVVVGIADTQVSGMSAVKLFKLYKGNDNVWVSYQEGREAPPQSEKVRVTGVVQEKEFSAGVGKKIFIQSESVSME